MLGTTPRQATGLQLIVAVVTLALWGQTISPHAVAQDSSGGYEFSDITVDYAPDPITDLPDPNHARITYSVSWAGEEFPGSHRCLLQVSDDDSQIIGERLIELTTMQASYSEPSHTDVNLHSPREPASASIRCDANRLDDANGRYGFSDVRLAPSDHPGANLEVHADVQWLSRGAPTPQTCVIDIYDAEGRLLATETVGFFDLRQGRVESSFAVNIPEDARADGRAAALDCSPLSAA